jgi:hypothetical protein
MSLGVMPLLEALAPATEGARGVKSSIWLTIGVSTDSPVLSRQTASSETSARSAVARICAAAIGHQTAHQQPERIGDHPQFSTSSIVTVAESGARVLRCPFALHHRDYRERSLWCDCAGFM